MTDISRLLDSYAIQSRLFPAALCVLPLIVSLAAWFPDSYELATGLVGSIGILAATLLLTNFSRSRGRKVERRIFADWGGMPASLWLRRSDSNLDQQTKERYYDFLESHVRGWRTPTAEEELANVATTVEIYDAAVRWLREHTRDAGRFPLVYKENVSYGFRRNAFGLKWYGFGLAALCIVANSLGLFLIRTSTSGLSNAGIVAGSISTLALVLWIIVVTEIWVRDAADGYARALLAACEHEDVSR